MLCGPLAPRRSTRVHIAHSVWVWLCDEHADPDVRYAEDGVPFAEALAGRWAAAGGLTRRHERALDALLRELDPPTVVGRRRSGSYAFPGIRTIVEDECRRRGPLPVAELRRIVERELADADPDGSFTPPGDRTLRRWQADGRWNEPGWQPFSEED